MWPSDQTTPIGGAGRKTPPRPLRRASGNPDLNRGRRVVEEDQIGRTLHSWATLPSRPPTPHRIFHAVWSENPLFSQLPTIPSGVMPLAPAPWIQEGARNVPAIGQRDGGHLASVWDPCQE